MRQYASGILGSATAFGAALVSWISTHGGEISVTAGCLAALFGVVVGLLTAFVWALRARREWRHRND